MLSQCTQDSGIDANSSISDYSQRGYSQNSWESYIKNSDNNKGFGKYLTNSQQPPQPIDKKLDKFERFYSGQRDKDIKDKLNHIEYLIRNHIEDCEKHKLDNNKNEKLINEINFNIDKYFKEDHNDKEKILKEINTIKGEIKNTQHIIDKHDQNKSTKIMSAIMDIKNQKTEKTGLIERLFNYMDEKFNLQEKRYLTHISKFFSESQRQISSIFNLKLMELIDSRDHRADILLKTELESLEQKIKNVNDTFTNLTILTNQNTSNIKQKYYENSIDCNDLLLNKQKEEINNIDAKKNKPQSSFNVSPSKTFVKSRINIMPKKYSPNKFFVPQHSSYSTITTDSLESTANVYENNQNLSAEYGVKNIKRGRKRTSKRLRSRFTQQKQWN